MNPVLVAIWCAMGGPTIAQVQPAPANDFSAQFGYGAWYTTNTNRTPDDEISEWIQVPQLRVNAAYAGSETSISARYIVSREIHSDETSENDTVLEGNAKATWEPVADRLNFSIENTDTRTTINARDQYVASNLQVTSTTDATATLFVDSFSDHKIEAGYRFTDVSADKTASPDSRQQGVFVSYIIPFSPTSSVRINGQGNDTTFDEQLASNYDARHADLEYQSSGATVDLTASAGYTKYQYQHGLSNTTGSTNDFAVVWRESGSTTLSASYSKSIEDGALDALRGIPNFGESFINNNSDLTQPYTLRRADGLVTTELGVNQVIWGVSSTDVNYAHVAGTNQQSIGTHFSIRRKIRPTWTAQFYAGYAHTHFDDPGQTDQDSGVAMELEWSGTRRLAMTYGVYWSKRDSDIDQFDFTEWAGRVSLRYTLF